MPSGKKGEATTARTLSTIMAVEDNVEFKKPTYTNAPDNGVDFIIKAPHNFPEKLNDIINNGESKKPLSTTPIEIRVDNKNYTGKIGKPVAEKFVDDIQKSPDMAEHWLMGGKELTSGAEKALEKATAPVRYYNQSDINKIDSFYNNEYENMNTNDNNENQ